MEGREGGEGARERRSRESFRVPADSTVLQSCKCSVCLAIQRPLLALTSPPPLSRSPTQPLPLSPLLPPLAPWACRQTPCSSPPSHLLARYNLPLFDLLQQAFLFAFDLLLISVPQFFFKSRHGKIGDCPSYSLAYPADCVQLREMTCRRPPQILFPTLRGKFIHKAIRFNTLSLLFFVVW